MVLTVSGLFLFCWTGWLQPIAAVAQSSSNTGLEAAVNKTLGLERSEVLALSLEAQPGEPFVVELPAVSAPFVLQLEPYSPRAAHYQVLAQVEDGSLLSIEPGPLRTLRGSVVGVPGSMVAGALLETGLVVRIALPDGAEYWLEPISARFPAAAADQYVLYRSADLLAHDGVCGLEGFAREVGRLDSGAAGDDPLNAGSGTAVTEFAADADYEYFRAYGSVAAVEERISVIINAVNVQYERDVGITHDITAIIVRTAEPDPYDTIYPGILLRDFRDDWLANHTHISRDLAQLFTGRDLSDSYAGIAFFAGTCNDDGYSLVQSDYYEDYARVTDLTAHELGHNWAAYHCTDCGDPPYTMKTGGLAGANWFHPEQTIPAIVDFRNSRDCLESGAGSCTEDLDGDGLVGFGDVLQLLAAWGPCNDCPQDLDGNGEVGFSDVLLVLAAWGPCQ